jgi:sec-independent protein translocase protein TatA
VPTIGPLELGIVLVIAVLLVGPKKLPGLGRSVGQGVRELRTSLAGADDDDRESDEKAAT